MATSQQVRGKNDVVIMNFYTNLYTYTYIYIYIHTRTHKLNAVYTVRPDRAPSTHARVESILLNILLRCAWL